MEQKFKVGDKVVYANVSGTELSSEKQYIVQGYDQHFDYIALYMDNISPSTTCWFHAVDFNLADETSAKLALQRGLRATVKSIQEKTVEASLSRWKESVRVEKMCHKTLLSEEAKLHNLTYCS